MSIGAPLSDFSTHVMLLGGGTTDQPWQMTEHTHV